MKNSNLIFTLIFVITLGIGTDTLAQKQSVGVLKYDVDIKKPVSRQFVDSIHAKLTRVKGIVHSTYSLDDKKLVYHPDLSPAGDEETVNQLMYYFFDINEYYKPSLTVNRDEAGKITWVGFKLSKEAVIGTKIIDLPSNTIGITRHDKIEEAIDFFDRSDNLHLIQLKDYKTRFGADPEALREKNNRSYQERLAKAQRDMASRFRKFYRKKFNTVFKAILATELEYYVPGPMACEKLVVEKDKVKEVTVTMPFATRLPSGISMRVFSLDTIENYIAPSLYGYYYIDKNENGKLILTSGLFSKAKKVGEAHLAGKKLYASFNVGGYGEKLNEEKQPLNIGLDFGYRSINKFEVGLSKYQGVNLIDISFSSVVDQFRERFKQERFINSDFSAKSVGANYLLNADKNTISLTDVATSKVAFNYNSGEGVKGLIDQTMGVFNQEIEVVKITKEKKGKVKKLLLYSPFGFTGDLKYTVYKKTYEDVGGEKVMRPIEVAGCAIYRAEGAKVAEFAGYGDEAKLYEAIKNNDDIFLRNVTYRLFGTEFK